MGGSCDADSCTRFAVTQWLIGILMTVMLGTQVYIVTRLDSIEEHLDKKLIAFEEEYRSDIGDLKKRVLYNEHTLQELIISINK